MPLRRIHMEDKFDFIYGLLFIGLVAAVVYIGLAGVHV